MYTKGTVLSVYFQCVETLVFVSKHAEGMSLRCDVICALAYCGRHESSHIIKVHTDSARFNKKIICGNLWQKKSLQKNICVIREIRGSKTSHEFVSFGVRLWVRQHFNPSRIYSNIDSIFLGVMTL